MHPVQWRCPRLTHVILLLSVAVCCLAYWRRPGCHLVGFTDTVEIEDCEEFVMTTNACNGFCESYSMPSDQDTLRRNKHQEVTSLGECCSITATEEIPVTIRCSDGLREVYMKSATACSCDHCKKE